MKHNAKAGMLRQIDKLIEQTKLDSDSKCKRYYTIRNGKLRHRVCEADLVKFRKKVETGKVAAWRD